MAAATEIDKYPAPALARGMRVLDALNKADGPLTLEHLSQTVGYPKASLLRLLETLSMLNLVERDEAGKQYSALAGITHHDRKAYVRGIVHREMEHLTLSTNITSEWYEARPQFVELVDLFDPPLAHVHISARIGFIRQIDDELEAVTRMALASGLYDFDATDLWQYNADGEKVGLSSIERNGQIADAQERGLTVDVNWNSNGIRRYAAAVTHKSELVGILSLAETFTPQADRQVDFNMQELKQAAMTIAEEIKD